MWRVGYVSGPLVFHPRPCFEHRFDDPGHNFRTLYCAEQRITALREALAFLRPRPHTLEEVEESLSLLPLSGELRQDTGLISRAWLLNHLLVPARLEFLSGDLVDLDNVELRHQLETRYAKLLREHGFAHLNISELRSTNRIVTQTIGRGLFDEGAAGVIFGSNLDDNRCLALFEGRCRLTPDGPAESLINPFPELLQVCREWDLAIEEGS